MRFNVKGGKEEENNKQNKRRTNNRKESSNQQTTLRFGKIGIDKPLAVIQLITQNKSDFRVCCKCSDKFCCARLLGVNIRKNRMICYAC